MILNQLIIHLKLSVKNPGKSASHHPGEHLDLQFIKTHELWPVRPGTSEG